MKIRRIIFLAVVLLFGTSAFAQFEVFGEYSYLRFNPTVSGVNLRNFNGGGGGFDLYFLKIFGIKGEVMGYASTTFTATYSSPVHLPSGGTIPPGTYNAQGNWFTAMAGPVIRIPIPKVKPFGEVLFGVSQTNGYVNLKKSIDANGGTISTTSSQHPFTMAAGGGVDISISDRFSIRPAEFDYVLSRYSNPLTNTTNQNNFRYCGGIVVKF